jgi:hypothetical protein
MKRVSTAQSENAVDVEKPHRCGRATAHATSLLLDPGGRDMNRSQGNEWRRRRLRLVRSLRRPAFRYPLDILALAEEAGSDEMQRRVSLKPYGKAIESVR